MEGKEKFIDVIQLSNYVRPEIKEVSNKEFVMNGDKNSFYTYTIDRYNGSPTNRTVIDSYAKFIYGKGLMSKQQALKPLQFAQVQQSLSKKDLRNICQDYALFSEASMEIIYKNGQLQKIKHVPKNQVLPNKMNADGEIEGYWFSLDFNQPRKYEPIFIPKWNNDEKKNGSYIYIISTYQVGRTYFTDPVYMAGLPYAELEEEIANYCINHIKNGLSFGYIINMNQGQPESDEVRQTVKKTFKNEGSGSINANAFMINWNDNKDTAITIESLQVSDAHQQYEFLSGEATQKLLISHKVTSPILFGIKDNTGLGNNADEMETAFNELMINVIQPMKEIILDSLMEVYTDAGMNIDLDFIPLRQPQAIQPTQLSKQTEHQDPIIAEALIELGEQISDEWELIDEIEQVGAPTIGETALNLASVPSSFPNVKSEQDTSLFKIRYKYAGSPVTDETREFCAKMMKADKVYRKEDIELAETKIVNAGLGLKGADTYSIWLYKGGVNCKHFWQRQIYLRRDNSSLSVNQARKMILELDPKDRPLAKWQENDRLVAQPAQNSNNNFRANLSLNFLEYNKFLLFNENRDENGRFAESDSSSNEDSNSEGYNPPKNILGNAGNEVNEGDKVIIKRKTEEGKDITPTLQVAIDVAKGAKIYDNRSQEFKESFISKYGDSKGGTGSLYFEKNGVAYRVSNHELPDRRYMESHNFKNVDDAIKKGTPTNKLFHQNNVEIIVKDGKIYKINKNFNY